jgi:hypothetical protein
MKHLISCVMCFILFSLCLTAQKNAFELKNGGTKWSFLLWNHNQTFDNQFFYLTVTPPIINGDTIYLFNDCSSRFSEVDGWNYGTSGYNIKKINKTTGSQYWEIQKQYKKIGERKRLSDVKVDDGTLLVTLFDEKAVLSTSWYDGYPGHIVVDRKKGIIIDSNYVDKTDPLTKSLEAIFDNGFGIDYKNRHLYKTDDGYLHRWRIPRLINKYLDEKGRFISTDTIHFPRMNYRVVNSYYNQINDSLFTVLFAKDDTVGWDKRQINLYKYDKEHHLINTYDLTEHLLDTIGIYTYFPITSNNNIWLHSWDDNYFIIERNFEIFAKSRTYTYYLFTNQGEYLDRLDYTVTAEKDNDPNITYAGFWPVVDKINNRLLFFHTRQVNSNANSFFEILTRDGDTLRTIKKVDVENKNDHLKVYHSKMMDNGDILIYFEQFEVYGNFNIGFDFPRWYGWAMIDGAKMGIVSSTDDIYSVRQPFMLFPNPTSSTLQIMTDADYDHVVIHSTSGKIIKQETVSDGAVNVSSLPNGTYVCTLMKGGSIISSGVKFVKVGK